MPGRAAAVGRGGGGSFPLALLAPEAPDAAALLYKVSTAALTAAAAYGWPGGRCFARLVGWFCAGNLLLAGALLLPGAQTNNGCIYLPPFAGGTAGGRGRVVLAVQGVLRLGRSGGQVFPPGLPWQTQRWMSGPSATPASRCRSRFRAGRWCWCGSVSCRAACRPPWVLIWSSTLPGPLPCPTRHLGCALFPCTTVAGHCILPTVPASLCCTGSSAGQGMAEHLYAAFADLPAA